MKQPTELVFGGVRALHGRLRLPGDKSISHRALLFAALANGRSSISNLSTGEDVRDRFGLDRGRRRVRSFLDRTQDGGNQIEFGKRGQHQGLS